MPHAFGGETAAAVAGKLDPAAASRSDDGKWLWYDARHLTIEGGGWSETEKPFHRLPARAKSIVRGAVWGLSTNSAGLCVRFVTDAEMIAARWTVTSKSLAMDHMPATGVSGLDLYVKTNNGYHWIGVGRPRQSPTNEMTLADHIPPGQHEYTLYLPLYNGVESLEVGVPPGATLSQAPPRPAGGDRPISFYGTSITQGGCASRPGMAYPAILGRRLDCTTINLGFSGNGQMEPELAELLADLDCAVYVLDCLPNLKPDQVTERVEPFVEKLRKARPQTPIVLMENVAYQAGAFLPDKREAYLAKNRNLRQAYERLLARGVKDLHYVEGEPLIGTDGESTVDGTHATDLGFFRMADALEPVLRPILKQPARSK